MLGCNKSLPGCCFVFAGVFWVDSYYQPSHKPLWWFGPYIWLNVSLWEFFLACQPNSNRMSHIRVMIFNCFRSSAYWWLPKYILQKYISLHVIPSSPVIACMCSLYPYDISLLNESALNLIAMRQGINGFGFPLKGQRGRKASVSLNDHNILNILKSEWTNWQ